MVAVGDIPHPRHCPPALLVAHESHQALDHVGDGTHAGIGDG